jgi:hypothetical protein
MTTEEKREKDIKDLNDKVTRILFHLESDPATNQKGIVEEVGIIKDTIKDMQMQTFKIGAVFGLIGGGIGWILKIVITKVLV